MILVQYVDNCGIGTPDMKIINKFIAGLEAEGLQLTCEGSFSEFLGIKFDNRKDGSIEMTQKGLIQKILKATMMEDCNPNGLPAAMASLGTDKDGEPMQESWLYRAVCGMLLSVNKYKNRHSICSESSVSIWTLAHQKHATAVKSIICYLKGTQDKGTIFRPSKWSELDLCVDANFCGLFKQEDN